MTVAVLTLVLLLSFASQAMAATDNIVITAAVNSKITVTAGADHSFGTLDPDAANPAPYVGPGSRALQRPVHVRPFIHVQQFWRRCPSILLQAWTERP